MCIIRIEGKCDAVFVRTTIMARGLHSNPLFRSVAARCMQTNKILQQPEGTIPIDADMDPIGVV